MIPDVRTPLALALDGLIAPASLREQAAWAAAAGFSALQLSAAAPGLRPRELSRSARRDVAAILRSSELSLSGVDLWIPPAHLDDPARADRALSALLDACDYTAEIAALVGGSPVLAVQLPPPTSAAAAVDALITRAASIGVRIADHAWPSRPEASQPDALAVGLDPPSILLAGADPAAEASRLSGRIAAARISDLGPAGRVPPGKGRLDLLSYMIALLARPAAAPTPVVDLRGIPDQHAVARALVSRWSTRRPAT
ncbi:MAG: hypothetical protein SFZ24_03860 [Planctomycetota bacterium]|nr:hypothetical protein [Planctomycetota bacterium]